ncbi:hypothetical protein L4C44_01800 [Vibrio satsumensis]|uniref:hypothetical protein n=1 Tax=Vibrio satsumensis TaxID=2910245 RepID=UPI003D0EDF28
MKALIPLILTMSLSTSLTGCGGGGGGGGSTSGGNSSSSEQPDPETTTVNDSTSPATVDSFRDIVVPDNFEWSSVETLEIAVNVVSSFSTTNGEPQNIRGSHIIKLFSTSNSSTDSNPFYTGISNKDGQLANKFSIPSHWQSITIIALVKDLECTSTYDLDELTSNLLVSCDINLDKD